MKRKTITILFVLYCALMLWLLLFQRIGQGVWVSPQLKPMSTITGYIRVLKHSKDTAHLLDAWKNLLGNLVMFVPLGFFVPYLWEKVRSFGKHLLTMAVIITAVELLQYVAALGTCDVDDLILNLLGTSVGWLLWKFLWK